jgi:hypothetical protein
MSDLEVRLWKLRQEVARFGSQKAFAEAIRVSQSTVSRTLNPEQTSEKQVAYLESLVAKVHGADEPQRNGSTDLIRGEFSEEEEAGPYVSEPEPSVEHTYAPKPTILPAFVLRIGQHEIMRVELRVSGRGDHAVIDMLEFGHPKGA